jgi:hypothetical protein
MLDPAVPPVLLRVLVADGGSSVNDGLTALLSEFADHCLAKTECGRLPEVLGRLWRERRPSETDRAKDRGGRREVA